MKDQYGDFQTPSVLAREVRSVLERTGVRWTRILEPTCGKGSFLETFADSAREVIGVEVQASYAREADQRLANHSHASRWEIIEDSIFQIETDRLAWEDSGPLLVVGNPPWVTNADMGKFDLANLPRKRNLKLLSGLEAITGKANFDIAEYIWLKLIEDLRSQPVAFAMLSKTHTARNVLEYVRARGISAEFASVYEIDARLHFGASVDACLMVLGLDPEAGPLRQVQVFRQLEDKVPSDVLSFVEGSLVRTGGTPDLSPTQYLGACELEWREGLKHDAAQVMELVLEDEGLRQKSGAAVDVEGEFVYPLMKSTDVFHGRSPAATGRRVLVYQRHLGAPTAPLEAEAPQLWDYLTANREKLDGRKSSIYRSQPRFALFGLGEYSFKPFKVAVSGLHKEPRFRLVGPCRGRPVMFDDTCYILAFHDVEAAAIVAAALQSPIALAVLRAITFTDSKRPIKKSVLKRISLSAVCADLGQAYLEERAKVLAEGAGFEIGPVPHFSEILTGQPSLFRETA